MGAACAWQTREGWSSRHFHLGDNKEAFDTEVFAIYQALKIFEARQQSGRKYTIFSDSQPAIRRAMTDSLGPGQQWARAIIEVASRLVASDNEVRVMWVPAHRGVEGNEIADRAAKEAAENRAHDVSDEIRWQTSLPHLSGRATEGRAGATSQWVADYVRPERRYHPRAGQGCAAGCYAGPVISRPPSDTTSCCPGMPRPAPS